MAKRKKPVKRKRKPTMLGESVFWNGNTYVVTTFETTQDETREHIKMTAVRYKPINF